MLRWIGSCCLLLATGASAQVYDWDVANVAQPGQATTYMNCVGGGDCGMPVEMADYDGDGIPDYAVVPLLTNSGPGGSRSQAGQVTVFKGTGSIGGVIDLQSPPVGQPLLTIWGAAAFDYLGTEMYSADVTGDGRPDLILGAMGADPMGRTRAGAVYVIPGGPSFGGLIDLAAPPSTVLRVLGRNNNDRLGIWVEAGDVNGDGVADLLMGADGGDGVNNAASNRGEVVVLFGGQAFPSVVDLANPPVGIQITTVYGVDDGDHLGTTLHSRDLDGDGIEELVAAAAMNRAGAANTGPAAVGGQGANNALALAGDTYIVWGRAVWPTTIDLSNPDPVTALSLTRIYGADSNDVLGEEITSGNFDGDAYNDLVLGALTAAGANNASFWAGDMVVVYGGPHLRGMTFDMALFPAGTSTIHGANANDILADTLSATDINQDGFDDLLGASPHKSPTKPVVGTVVAAGVVDVLFGGPVRWPSQLTLGNVSRQFPIRQVWGAEQGDLLAYSMEAGDFDGDGFGDLFPNAMRGDGFNNLYFNAGEVNIVSGYLFSKGLPTLAVQPKVGTMVTVNMVAEASANYIAAFSLSDTPGIPIPGVGTIQLTPDAVFFLSLDPLSPYFSTMTGTLAGDGRGQYGIFLPNLAPLVGLEVYTAFVTLTGGGAVQTISSTTSMVLLP